MNNALPAKKFRPGQFFLFGMFVICAIIFADQYTKWLVLETMLRAGGDTPAFQDWFMTRQPLEFFIDQREVYQSREITGFLNFVMVWNTGISFGLFSDNADMEKSRMLALVFIALSLTVALALIVWLAVARSRLLAAALSLIVGGAIANVIDRVRFGAVADFVDVHAAGFHWPAFNLADSCIAIGALFLVIDTLTSKDKGILD
ncbi:MAG TPA: signal peptidase II [Alphaproteobacteria bacterium]|mgnify:CR=1 FL=1|nr:signal peptidase II [Alphaproteobacteria bacterium]